MPKTIYPEIADLDSAKWGEISKLQHLDLKFIKKYKDRVDWQAISRYNRLLTKKENLNFIMNYAYMIDFAELCIHQELTEELIENLKDYIYWPAISKYQVLTEQFMQKHENKLDWDKIYRYQDISTEFAEKHKYKLNEYYLEF